MASLSERIINRTQRHGVSLVMFLASVAESTLVPVPIEFIMAPVMQANREKLWRIAVAVLLGCIAGSSLAYFTGHFAYETLGRPFLEWMGQTENYLQFRTEMRQHGIWAVALIAISPIPLVTAGLGAGVSGMNYFAFIALVGAMRSVRYFGIGAGVYYFGDRFERFLKNRFGSKRSKIIAWAATAAIVIAAVVFSWSGLMGGEEGAGEPSAAAAEG